MKRSGAPHHGGGELHGEVRCGRHRRERASPPAERARYYAGRGGHGGGCNARDVVRASARRRLRCGQGVEAAVAEGVAAAAGEVRLTEHLEADRAQ
jgi:hypothetical protein